MNWMILGATPLIVLIPVIVIRLRRASRTLDAIMAEHQARMSGTVTSQRHQGRHRRPGRGPRTVRTGDAAHRRMSA